MRPPGTHTRRVLPWLVLIASILVAASAAGSAQARSAARAGVEHEAELAATVADRVSDLRAGRDLRRLARSTSLAHAARAHAVSMARKGYFSHLSLDGSSVERRVGGSYGAGPGAAVGEVIFWQVGSASAEEIVATWLASSVHRGVLLHPRWQDVGVSVVLAQRAPGVFGSRDVTIAVVDFGDRG